MVTILWSSKKNVNEIAEKFSKFYPESGTMYRLAVIRREQAKSIPKNLEIIHRESIQACSMKLFANRIGFGGKDVLVSN